MGMKSEVPYNVTHLSFMSVGFYVKVWRESNAWKFKPFDLFSKGSF